MKLALLGHDDESLRLLRWAVSAGGHELVAAYDVGPAAAEVRALAPQVRLGENWEALILVSAADAVIVGRSGAGLANETGIAQAERRADQLRKLTQAAVPMIVVCPACEALVGFEIDMIRRDTRAVIVPFSPGAGHPGIARLAELVSWGEASPLGKIEQVTFERESDDRSRGAVLEQLARDCALLRQLIGTVQSVSAAGPTAPVGRDPLGPKPRVLPSLANLGVHLAGESGLTARWSIGPALAAPAGRLTVIGERGKATLSMPAARPWALEMACAAPFMESYESQLEAEGVFARLSHPEFYDESAWLSACRDQEVAEAVDRSLARGRTIELFNEEHTEEESFKGIMAMGGCLMLVFALAVVFLATVVEGLRLPMRDWALWRLWPFYVLVPIVAFLLLQLLQLAVKREPGDIQHILGGKEPGR
jgi:hypothetical protein